MAQKKTNTPEGCKILREFKISNYLGRGCFGTVVEAKSRFDAMSYALKMTFQDLPETLNEVKLFSKLPPHENVIVYVASWAEVITKKELKIILDLIGPSARHMIIPYGVPKVTLLCIQMELCSQDLKVWLAQRKTLVILQSQSLFMQLLRGLLHIHQHNIIHRDMKPSNIFLTSSAVATDIRLKIGDFGISTQHYGSSSASHTGNFGDQLYMAPERVSTRYDKSSDLYPMGLILYELYHPPAQLQLALSLMKLKNDKVLPDQFESWPLVSATIRSLLEFDPQKRPTIDETIKAFSQADVAPVLHLGVVCNRCQERDFSGVRYKCAVCTNVDLCEKCEAVMESHDATHPLIKIRMPGTVPATTPAYVARGDQPSNLNPQATTYIPTVRVAPQSKGRPTTKKLLRLPAVSARPPVPAPVPARVPSSVHVSVRCDGCRVKPVVGNRYKCKTCLNFDYCQNCYNGRRRTHPSSHEFKTIAQHRQFQVPCAGCRKPSIRGDCYVCQECPDVHYCSQCFSVADHHRQIHHFNLQN